MNVNLLVKTFLIITLLVVVTACGDSAQTTPADN
jgi:hypothetical protein